MVQAVRPKKVVLFPEIGRMNLFFYRSPARRIVECVSEYIYIFFKKSRRQKAK